ncbi:Zinc finger, SWIM-type [Phytophthora cactorum]|nr:Zinc finger, SWIM-type [Phytophthora cactorum]
MNVILGMTAGWVATAIKTQYDFAVDPAVESAYDNGDMVTVRRVDHENLLRKESWECDCEFAKIMKLPCRHAMCTRSQLEVHGMTRADCLHKTYPKWRSHLFAKIFEQPTASAVMQTEQQKYRRAQQAFSRISGEISQFSDDAFDSAMSQFGEWWHNLRQGQTVIPPPHSSGGRGHHDHSKEGGSTGVVVVPVVEVRVVSVSVVQSGVNDDSDEVPPSQQAGVQTLLQTLPEHAPIYVTLNGRVVPVGRPDQTSQSKVESERIQSGHEQGGMLRERDVCEVAAALKEIDPCLREASSFLATFQVLGKTTGKHLIWCLDTEFVSDNVWYRLPEPTIDRALEFLRERLPGEQAEIHLDSDGEIGDSDGYMVAIETIGTYTREQLKSMKWLWNLQATCRRGVALCTWFNTEVKRLVNEPGPVAGAFDKILNAWPDKTISSFGFDITMSDIFCMRGSTWLNDDAMCASSVLLQHYNNNSTVTMPPLKQQSRKYQRSCSRCFLRRNFWKFVRVSPFARLFWCLLISMALTGAAW